MKKKILIGSIIAVVILTLVSFSSVVGYNSVKSDSKIASPLFGIRTNRAINNKQDAVTSDYIGKGKAINILLPKRNDRTVLLHKFIDSISKMDAKAFIGFLSNILNRINYNDRIRDENFIKIILPLQYLKNNPEDMNEYLFNINSEPDDRYIFERQDYTLSGGSILRCLIEIIMLILIEGILGILDIFWFFATAIFDCIPDTAWCIIGNE